MKRIYIAGPLTQEGRLTESERVKNVNRAITIAHLLADLGFAPFVPHLSHYWDVQYPREYSSWMEIDFAFLAVCDGLYRMNGHSPGADREVAFAGEHGIPVFHYLKDLTIHFAKVDQTSGRIERRDVGGPPKGPHVFPQGTSGKKKE